MDFYQDKNILILGATGDVGQKLTEKLLKQNPKVIRLFSRDEYKQYLMQDAFKGHDKKLRYLIGDVRDYERVARASKDIDIIFHLAAMKHVPSCEYNPFEAVQTNIIGMQNVIKAATENGVQKVIFTSSDKAISPTNAMGATKLLAEKLIQAADYSQGGKTIYSAVRFGNVMGTRGSVIPFFKRQILEEGKVTVTDETMSRFMMSLESAADLVLKAGEEAYGGEIRVFKMPILNIKDLYEVIAEALSRKHGFSKAEIKIEQIGLRPGEKMYEELMTEEESRHAYDAGDYFIIPPMFSKGKAWTYPKAQVKPYGSQDEKAISKLEILDILTREKLI